MAIDLGRTCAEPFVPGHGKGVSGYVFTTVSASCSPGTGPGVRSAKPSNPRSAWAGTPTPSRPLPGLMAGEAPAPPDSQPNRVEGIFDVPRREPDQELSAKPGFHYRPTQVVSVDTPSEASPLP